MATITTRAGKGSPLTNTEVDDNFSNLNSAKYESGSAAEFASVDLPDDGKIKLGDGDDLQIYHDGSDSYIDDAGTGALAIRASTGIILGKYTGETMASFIQDGAVTLNYDNAAKLATSTTGVSVTGEVAATSLDISGDIDVDGTTNLDAVDIDGAVNIADNVTMASTNPILDILADSNNDATLRLRESGTGIVGAEFIYDGGDNSLILQIGNNSANTALTVARDTGNSVFGGTVTANAGVVVDNFTLNGNTLSLSSGDLTLDSVAGDIVLDAHGNQVTFRGAQGQIGFIDLATGRMDIKVSSSDAQMRFQGNDGGTAINALTLDMADAGSALFNNNVTVTGRTTSELDLKAIAQSKSHDAKDVFVYDTSKDSDGGAWRKGTKQTSWYNETLNTSTRGARREFPSVAVIVAEDQALTIYDGDDPDMPMWMKFNNSTRVMLGGESGSGGSWLSAVEALNGELIVGSVSGYSPFLFSVNLISEKGRMWHHSGHYRFIGDVSERNSALGMKADPLIGTMASLYVRGVSVKVLPNARVNVDTGLPRATIAAGVHTGVTIVHDDDSVVNITHTSYGQCNNVVLLPSGGLAYTSDTSSNSRWLHVHHQVPRTSIAKGLGYEGVSDDEMYHAVNGSNYSGQHMKLAINNMAEGLVFTEGGDLIVASDSSTGHAAGLGLIHRNPESPADGMTCEINAHFNTGWLVGGSYSYVFGSGYPTRGALLATLSHTSNSDVTGANIVSNGTFSDTTDWIGRFGSISVVSGKIRVDRGTVGSGNGHFAVSPISCVVGGQYRVTYTQSSAVNCSPIVRIGVGNNNPWSNLHSDSTSGTHSFNFIATQATHYLYLGQGSTAENSTIDYDNVYIRPMESDRSAIQQGLPIYGTITKDVVSTSADLVSYSGFSSTNYFRQPYTSNLDFAAGSSFSIMFWNNPTSSGDSAILYRGDNNLSTQNPSAGINIWTYGAQLKCQIAGGGIYGNPSTSAIQNRWTHCHFVCRAGIGRWYINGIAQSGIGTVGAISAGDLFVGEGYYANTSTRLALLRISDNAPTDEQISKIYNDEKPLFQPGAQATLYGSSSAVQAVAYDEDTGRLHAGTSTGRSVFQGLRRVDNTTDAVGHTISASNGLVVED